MKLRCNLTKGESYEVGICDKNGGFKKKDRDFSGQNNVDNLSHL